VRGEAVCNFELVFKRLEEAEEAVVSPSWSLEKKPPRNLRAPESGANAECVEQIGSINIK
jgi:hypothetical protein